MRSVSLIALAFRTAWSPSVLRDPCARQCGRFNRTFALDRSATVPGRPFAVGRDDEDRTFCDHARPLPVAGARCDASMRRCSLVPSARTIKVAVVRIERDLAAYVMTRPECGATGAESAGPARRCPDVSKGPTGAGPVLTRSQLLPAALAGLFQSAANVGRLPAYRFQREVEKSVASEHDATNVERCRGTGGYVGRKQN